MTDKPLRSLNGKKFTGSLATPIDHGFFMPIDATISSSLPESPDWPEYLKRSKQELHRQRMAKMPDLARHLGIDIEQFNLSDPSNGFGLSMLLGAIALKLASHVVPGFQEKPRGKHPREIVRFTRRAIDAAKAARKDLSDLDVCREIIKLEQPELARPGKKGELERKAKSLRNLVSKDRASAERKRPSSPSAKRQPARKRG
jgi:hypothetical protein